ncbi:MAG: chitobiase/beta-hexosaminidase C-terminal domain-containing protein [Bacteroidaceae bacterium]|nr:chitobiase/beta-hexosaminidase C-terminal domain-containing protein [Bacteroidaceae bacterium]
METGTVNLEPSTVNRNRKTEKGKTYKCDKSRIDMRKFLNILLLLIAFALNVSVVNAKNSTGQGGSCKEFMMAMMDSGDPESTATLGTSATWEYGTYRIYVDWDADPNVHLSFEGSNLSYQFSDGHNTIQWGFQVAYSKNDMPKELSIDVRSMSDLDNSLGTYKFIIKPNNGSYICEYYGKVSGGGTSTKPQAPTFNARRATSGDSSDDTFGPTPEQRIYITNHENEAKIYYTTDGSDPDASSMEYSGVIAIQPDNFPNYENIESITISAVAIKNGIASDIVRQQYYKTSPAPVITFSNNQIQITSHQDCYLTIDNGTGNYERQNSSSYTITPSGTMTVSVRCIEQNKLFSNIATYTYQGTTPVAAPTIDETLAYNKDGLYNFYTINNGASGLTVKYTTDGSDPKNSGTSLSFTDASKRLNKSTLDIVGDSLQIIAIAKDNNGNYSSTTKRTFYKTEMPTYTDNGTSVTFHATSTKKIYIKVDNATSWDGSYTSDKTYQKSDFQTIQVVALSSDNKHLYSDILVYENKITTKSATPIIKYLEDNTATPNRKYILVEQPNTNATYTGARYTTDNTAPSETNGSETTSEGNYPRVVTTNPTNGITYKVIAKEQDETSVSYSYSDPVSFTYNSANIPVISCENNTVTISNPGNFYKIYYTKNQADNNFHYADDSSTPYTRAFTIDENSIVCIYAIPNGIIDYVVEVKQNCEYTTPASKPAAPSISINHGLDDADCTPPEGRLNCEGVIDGCTINALNNYIYISTETNDAKIYYTTDNSDPTDNTNANRHELTNGKFIFDINQTGYDAKTSLTVKAAAFKDNVYSDVKNVTFNKSGTPSISRSDNTVTITATGYTWLAYKPNASSQWIRRIDITKTISNYTDGTQISAVAATSGCLLSNPATYPTSQQTSAPSITCINNVVTITNNSADPNATIYYSTDGTTIPTYDNSGNPGTNTYKYTDQFTIQSTCTVKAIAVASGKTASEVASLLCAYQDPPTITHNQADNTVYIYGGPQVAVYYSTDNGQSWNSRNQSVTLNIPENGSLTVQAYSETSQSGHTITSNIVSGGPYNYVAPASDIWVPTSSGAKTGTFTWIQKVTFNDHVINLNFGDAIKNGNALYFNCSAITDNSTWKVEFEYGSGQWTSIDNVKYSSGGHNVYYDEWLRNNSIQKSSFTGNVRIRVDSPTAGTMTISDAGIIQYPAVNTTQKCVETGYTDCYLTTFTPFDFLDATISGFRGGNYNYLTGVFSRTDANNKYFEIPVSGLKVKNIKRLVLNYSDPNETAGTKILILRDSNGKDIVATWTSDWTNTDNTTDETDISSIRVILIAKNGSEKPLNFTINNLKMYLTGVGTLPTSGDWDYGTWTQGSDGANTIIQIYGNSAKILRYTVSDTRGQNEPTESSGTEIINQNSVDVPVSTLADGTHYVQLYVVDYSNPPLPLGVYTWKVTKSGNDYTYEYLGKNEKALVVELDDNFELIDGEPDYDDHFLISGEAGSVIHYIFKYEDSSLGGMATITSGTVTLANDGTGSISLNTINAPVSFNSSNPLVLEVYSEKNGQTSPTTTYQFVRSAVANQGQIGNTITFEALDGDADGLEYFYQYWDYTQDAFVWSEKKTDINYTFDFTVATSPKSITTISKQAGMLKAGTQALDILQFEKPDVPNITYDEGTGKVTISTDEEGAAQFPVYLIYTTDGSEPSFTVNGIVPEAGNDNTVVFEGNSTEFPISETTTVNALVYCANASKYYTPTSVLATDTFTIASEWTDWEPYGRGTWNDPYYFINGASVNVYVRTNLSNPNKKQIKVDNLAGGFDDPNNFSVESGKENLIFDWNIADNNSCSVDKIYTGITDLNPYIYSDYIWLIPARDNQVAAYNNCTNNGEYNPKTDTYTLNFYYHHSKSTDKPNITSSSSDLQLVSATLKMEGMWLGDMEEDDNDYSAVQYSYMPQLSQYTVGLVKIDSENPNLSFTDGVCRIELDEPDGVEEFFENSDNFVGDTIQGRGDTVVNNTNYTQYIAFGDHKAFKMLDQFTITDEGAYYIVVARQVSNGDGTYSYTGAYQYMPVYFSPSNNWEVVGARTYKDDVVGGSFHYKDPNDKDTYIGPTTYKVLVEENINTPGLFRVKNMYLYQEEGLSYDPTYWWYTYQGEDAGRRNVYFYIDATNADSVKLFPNEFYAQPLGIDYGYGEMMLISLGNGVYEDGYIKFKNDRIEDGEDGWDGMIYEWEDCRQNGFEYDGTYVFNWKYTNADINPVNRFYLQISLPYPLYDGTPYTVDDMTAVNDDDEEKDDDVKDDEDSNYEWTIPNGGRHLDVTYDRILSNVWGTVMLPCKFEASDLKLKVDGGEYSEDAGFSLYELVGQVGSQLKFSLLDSQKAEANTPVVFKYQGLLPNDATLSIDIKDTKVVAVTHVTEPTVYRDSQFYVVNCNGWELLGTYTPVAITDNEHENDMKSGGSQLERYGYEVIKDYPLDQSYFINGNKVNQVDGGIRVRQYRSFIYDATSSGIKSFSVFFDDEKPDAVGSINHRPVSQYGGRVNLAGQRVDDNFRGIVIEGGRKKFVR